MRDLRKMKLSTHLHLTLKFISSLSKVLEYHVLDKCDGYNASPCQFGFVPNRNTNMAAALAHDVSAFCVASGSPVYLCSPDAEGAFDNLPLSVLFKKAIGIIPDRCWCLMYYWYQQMCIQIRWRGTLSDKIPVKCGTRQGGLTSPLLFNIFYEDTVRELQTYDCGVIIGQKKYNVYCYADDLLIASTTSSGLQQLIDRANTMLSDNGLKFNPTKTECLIVGSNLFTSTPQWNLNGVPLPIRNNLMYLGISLGDSNGQGHVNTRVSKARKSFYWLQGPGLNPAGVSPETGVHIYTTAVQSTLTYGCASVNISKSNLKQLDTIHGKCVKAILGVSYCSRTTPLLQALNLDSVTKTVQKQSLDLLKCCLTSDSITQNFYCHIYKIWNTDKKHLLCNTLLHRVLSTCKNEHIDFTKYVLDQSYVRKVKCMISNKISNGQNGLVDSVRALLLNYNANNRRVLQMLVKAF